MQSTIKKAPVIFLGSLLCAIGASYCVMPADLLAGGTTGIGIIVNRLTGCPISAAIWITSLSFFIWGRLALGREFAMNTMIGSLSYPICYSLTSRLIARTGIYTDDIFLCMVFAGVFTGVGLGIILRIGASTGATDVPAVILHQKWGISSSLTLNVIDALILCLQIPFSSAEGILYGLLYICIYSVLIDKVIVFGQDKIQIQVISSMYEEINHAILQELDHGSTLIHMEGGYKRSESYIVQTVITKRDLFRVREAILQIDPQAFVVINPVSEVDGRGFTLSQIHG